MGYGASAGGAGYRVFVVFFQNRRKTESFGSDGRRRPKRARNRPEYGQNDNLQKVVRRDDHLRTVTGGPSAGPAGGLVHGRRG